MWLQNRFDPIVFKLACLLFLLLSWSGFSPSYSSRHQNIHSAVKHFFSEILIFDCQVCFRGPRLEYEVLSAYDTIKLLWIQSQLSCSRSFRVTLVVMKAFWKSCLILFLKNEVLEFWLIQPKNFLSIVDLARFQKKMEKWG